MPTAKQTSEFPEEDELLDTDSDDSDFTGGSAASDEFSDELTENSHDIGGSHDSDFEAKTDSSGSESGSDNSSDPDSSSDGRSPSRGSSDSLELGNAPLTGYIFPAIHKLVSAGNVISAASYLEEMFNSNTSGLQVWEIPDSLGRNALHLAILHNNLDMVRLLLQFDVKNINSKYADSGEEKWKFSIIRRKFDEMSVLHLALWRAPWDEDLSIEMLELLYQHPAISSVPTMDYWKRSPLHIAAITGKIEVARYLIEKNPSWLCEVDGFNMLPLHYSIDTKDANMMQFLLMLSLAGERTQAFQDAIAALPEERHPISHCVSKCSWECLVLVCQIIGHDLPHKALEIAEGLGIELGGLADISKNLEAARKCVLDRSRETAVVYDLDCLGHVRLPSEIEDGHTRLKRIKFVVENPNRLEVLIGQNGSLKTTEFQSLRVVTSVPPCPLGDVVRVHEWAYIRKVIDVVNSAPHGGLVRLDRGDTNVTSESWNAALKASGAVVHAMDLVCSEACKNAFVAVRPPGHHVSSRGAVDPNLEDDDTGSNGFCLLNNVAIGAAYALSVHRHAISRIAILDFDIHHGNGTEAIIRDLREPKNIDIPIGFIGLTGNLEMHSYHPWLDRNDSDNVFFSSIHRFDGRFYPQSGQTGVDANIVNAGLSSFSSSADFRKALSHHILPRLDAFKPDIIMISAGFDGHVRDRLASGEWEITEEDYYWVTERLVAIANTHCKGRIVSVLEGGYNTKGGWLSPLAQSVASHVRALSSSWACKYTPPSPEELAQGGEDEDEEEEEEDESELESVSDEGGSDGSDGEIPDVESERVVEGITDLLARADAVLNDEVSHASDDSPSNSNKRIRLDGKNELSQLFGNE
jgi:acetoin utilization deacetylase AcuC-like enzyme/ankyrin repeat protein